MDLSGQSKKNPGIYYGWYILSVGMLGLALGPIIASISFDLTGSYQAVFIFFIIAAVISSALLWMAKKPVPAP